MDKNVLFKKDMKEKQELVNIILDRFLPRKDEYPKEIHKAIRYSLFAGGKRLRPYMTTIAWQMYRDDPDPISYIAASIEMMHTYSLIHDDLPDIDNDEYRRGKKSCHAVFGEAVALLAGDALLITAFEILSYAPIDEKIRIQLIRELAQTCGVNGLIGGQMMDISSTGKKIDKKTLDYIHENKTGKLIKLALRFGAVAAKAPEKDVKLLEEYGDKIGLAFQIIDDLLDIEGDPEKLGKSIGKDEQQQKATYPSVYGIEESKRKVIELIEGAKSIATQFGAKGEMLVLLADYIQSRKS